MWCLSWLVEEQAALRICWWGFRLLLVQRAPCRQTWLRNMEKKPLKVRCWSVGGRCEHRLKKTHYQGVLEWMSIFGEKLFTLKSPSQHPQLIHALHGIKLSTTSSWGQWTCEWRLGGRKLVWFELAWVKLVVTICRGAVPMPLSLSFLHHHPQYYLIERSESQNAPHLFLESFLSVVLHISWNPSEWAHLNCSNRRWGDILGGSFQNIGYVECKIVVWRGIHQHSCIF